ncbi:hypothetical protein MNBD_NITROSPINAE04-266, partial [hydrothermal vent metagenome]
WFKKEFFAVALVFLLFSGCGGGVGDVTTGTVSSTGSRISLNWPPGYSYNQADGAITTPSGSLNATLPAYVTSMTLIISGEGIDSPVTFNVPLDTLTVNFAITPGIRIFTILISTSIPGLSFTASQTIELVAGEQVDLDFSLVINAPPVVDSVSVSDSTPQTRSAISVSCNATDPDDDSMTYSWSYKGSKGSFSGSGATVSFTATSGGSITITCTASDGKGGEGEGSVTVIANAPPVIKSVTASDTSPNVGDTITLTCDASDPDGDRLSYAWSDDLGSGSQVTYTVTSAGSKTFTCTVSDGRGGTANESVSITGKVALYKETLKEDLTGATGDDYWKVYVRNNADIDISCSPDTGSPASLEIEVKDNVGADIAANPVTVNFTATYTGFYELRVLDLLAGAGNYTCTVTSTKSFTNSGCLSLDDGGAAGPCP